MSGYRTPLGPRGSRYRRSKRRNALVFALVVFGLGHESPFDAGGQHDIIARPVEPLGW